MKNREKAEARANELFPQVENPYNNYHLNLVNTSRVKQIDAFLQCYDEMEKQMYTEADLVSFCNYLGHEVTHADLENWKNERK